MIHFCKKHKTLSCLLIISIGIVIFYLTTLELPEAFRHAGDVLIILETLALSYIASFIFYVLQVYIPEEKRSKRINKSIKIYTDQIVEVIRRTIGTLISNHMDMTMYDKAFNAEKLKDCPAFSSKMKVPVSDIRSIYFDESGQMHGEKITVRE